VLWGGNLSLVCSLLGSTYFPRVDGGILFLEEVNEHPYRVERMMTQLLHTGVLDRPRAGLHPKQVYNLDDFPLATKSQADTGVTRNGKKVTVRITSVAPAYEPTEFNVKVGDEVTLILTNLDKVEDLTHGFAIPEYNIQFIVNPQETKSVTFKIDKPGVFWYYCTNFCHALHLEMRGRMIVEP